MNEQTPLAPDYHPPVTTSNEAVSSSTAPSIKLLVILMVWPVVAFVLTVGLYALTAYIVDTMVQPAQDQAQLFTSDSHPVWQIGINVVLFLVGALSVVAGPPSFIVGLVLLIMRKSNKQPVAKTSNMDDIAG